MASTKDYAQLPNSTDHNCFGCSPVNPSGLQMKFSARQDTVISNVTIPDHLCGWSKIAHGGVLTTVLDEIMSWTALHFLKRITMTKSMNIEFIKPVYICNPLIAEGKVLEQTDRHGAVMEGVLYNDKGVVCAKSTADFAVFSPKIAKRLGIADDTSLKFFADVFGIK
ncbi:MAG: PaaI family thioesterase [bacterium]|nr:PaaI family thioesterase [bacterium]